VATKQITIERFSVVSAKPFTEVVRAIEAQVGQPDIKQFYEAIREAEDDQECSEWSMTPSAHVI